MFCPFCGHQNRDGKKFCRQCGRTVPAARANVGTTPLPHYNSFAEEAATPLAEASFPLNNQTSPQNQIPSNQLIDQSIYSNFSPSVEKFDKGVKASSAIAPQWQPGVETESEQDYNQEEGLEDQLNQFTQQLLPDTIGFEAPKSMPPLKGNGENGSHKANFKQSENLGNTPKVSSFGSPGLNLKKSPSPTKLSSSDYAPPPQIDFNDYNDSNDYAPTDEMEALLDKSLEKTQDIPVLTEKTADMPVLTEKTQDLPLLEKEKTQDIPLKPSKNSAFGITPVATPNIVKPSVPKQEILKDIPIKSNFSNNSASRPLESNFSSNVSRPLTGTLSINAPTGTLVEESRRTERVILIILSLIALIGVSILIWVLILRPLGII